jgi:hypothetical protein
MNNCITLIPPLIIGGIAGFTLSSNFFNWLYDIDRTERTKNTLQAFSFINKNDLLKKPVIEQQLKKPNELHIWEKRIVTSYYISELLLIIPFFGFSLVDTTSPDNAGISIFFLALLYTSYIGFLVALSLTFIIYSWALSKAKKKPSPVRTISDQRELEEYRKTLRS